MDRSRASDGGVQSPSFRTGSSWRGFVGVNLSVLLEVQRAGVHAVAQTRWIGTIGKDMTQMRAAMGALYFDPMHAVAVILHRTNILFIERRVETRPSGARIKFRA